MTHIRYDIFGGDGGWCVRSGDVVGPPYNRKPEALRDVAWTAALLQSTGDEVEVFLDEGHGPVRYDFNATASAGG